jgi:hypothetical protein
MPTFRGAHHTRSVILNHLNVENMMKTLLCVFVLLAQFDCCYSQKIKAELTFVYWMPYDNNLSVWADSIYQMIDAGVESSEIAVTIQKDILGDRGMTRSIISNKEIVNYEIADENSSSGKSFSDYLSWVSSKITSDSYVIIFLDHGGKLDEIGLDEFPEKRFLRIDSARMAIDQFNKVNGKKTELVFMQVCTKGSIEPLYELKDIARYTMFSQTTLGAPNFYYTPFFKSLTNSDIGKLTGIDLARSIVDFEREDMYSSLVCIDNSRFDSFELAFDNFLNAYEDLHKYEVGQNLSLNYYGQRYWDLVAFIKSFEGVSSEGLLKGIDDLVVMHRINPKYGNMQGYCGISTLAMNRNYLQEIAQYNHLRFFKAFNTRGFYEKSVRLLKK